MQQLDELIRRLKDFESRMFEIIEQVIRDNEDIITEMISEDQLYEKGIDGDGIAIDSYAPYSPITIEIKQLKGQPTSRVTLRDTGDFHYSFYIKYTSDGFEITASDWKTQDLIKGYGEAIMKLTDENFRDIAINYVQPELVKLAREL